MGGGAGAAKRDTSTQPGTIAQGPPSAGPATARAVSDTAVRAASRRVQRRSSGPVSRYSRPAAGSAEWNVPSKGASAWRRNASESIGISGSCTCTTSKRSRRDSRRTRDPSRGSSAIGATVPPPRTPRGRPRIVACGGVTSRAEAGPMSWTSCPCPRTQSAMSIA